MDEDELRRRFAGEPVGRLATVRPDGAPHVVPIVFALVGGLLYTAVDHKPKRTRRLQRLDNLRHEPRCSVLVDRYEADWSALWWVRADGIGAVVDDAPPDHPGRRALTQRHAAYRTRPPSGPLLVVTVQRWSGWSAAD